MLRVAVTGGIGSGKSTVSTRLAERGAVVVDSDRLSREVVAPGSPGLAAVVDRFGPSVLAPDGSLDRPALAAVVFADPESRRALEAVIHPRVRERFDAMAAAAPADAVVVNDIPLLVALEVAASFHLVVGVGADAGLRVRRLIGRGLTESDARARIAAQIDDATRRPLTDVWLDNSGTPDSLIAAVDRLWDGRLSPFEDLLGRHERAPRGGPALVPPDPGWSTDAARLLARVRLAAGDATRTLDHIGSTAVPGLPAKDVIDLQLGVLSLADLEPVRDALARAGFVSIHGIEQDQPHPADDDPRRWSKRFLANADPGRAVNLHVREVDSPGWRWALAFRDWLTADAGVRGEYQVTKRQLADTHAGDATVEEYATAKETWFAAVAPRLEAWTTQTGWAPSARV